MTFAFRRSGRRKPVRTVVGGASDGLRSVDQRRIQRRLTPGGFDRQFREIDDRSVAAVGADVQGRPHEDAIDRTRFHAQSTEHALGIVDRERGDGEAFALDALLFVDVDAVDGAGSRTLVAADAGREIEAVKAAVPDRDFRQDSRRRLYRRASPALDEQFSTALLVRRQLPPIRVLPNPQPQSAECPNGG